MDKLPCLVAIDTASFDHAKLIVNTIANRVAGVKVGLEFFCSYGIPGVIELLDHRYNLKLFLDLKLHDIPNTVTNAAKSVFCLNPDFLSIHIVGGAEMINSVAKSISNSNLKTKLIGISVLTSMNQDDSDFICASKEPISYKVSRLAKFGVSNGLNGVVCSAHEVKQLRTELPITTTLIVPGVRLDFSDLNDQKRVGTPKQAIIDGASYVVIGRHVNKNRTEKDINLSLDQLEEHFA